MNDLPDMVFMKRTLSLLLLVALFLAACTSSAQTPTTAATENTVVTTAAPTATPTEEPITVLNICTASLPESAFPYDGRNLITKQNLLALTQREIFPGADAAMTLRSLVSFQPRKTEGSPCNRPMFQLVRPLWMLMATLLF